jgi:hypothetical protein
MRNGGSQYGLFLGVAFVAFHFLLPAPAGDIAMWSCIFLQLAQGAILTWRRMRLPLSALSMSIGSVICLIVVGLYARGYTITTLPLGWAIPLGIAFAAMLLMMPIESHFWPEKSRAWREFMRSKSALDVLTGDHFPNMRG